MTRVARNTKVTRVKTYSDNTNYDISQEPSCSQTDLDQPKTTKRGQKQTYKQAAKNSIIGKREVSQRKSFEVEVDPCAIPRSEEYETVSSGLHFMPLLGGGSGRNSVMKAGMAIGSLLAITTCMVGVLSSSDQPVEQEALVDFS